MTTKKPSTQQVPPRYSEAAKDFIRHYQNRFHDVITVDPLKQPQINYPRVMKPAMQAVGTYGLERLSKLLEAYLQSDDKWFREQGWSLELFLSTSTLNRLSINL